MSAQQLHAGGSFAPPLSDETLESYGNTIAHMPNGPVRDACSTLHNCCLQWWGLPEPTHAGNGRHASGVGNIIPLHPDHAAALDPHLPWEHELNAIHGLLDSLPTGPKGSPETALRDMAFHLLWHVREIELGREPITKDKLGI